MIFTCSMFSSSYTQWDRNSNSGWHLCCVRFCLLHWCLSLCLVMTVWFLTCLPNYACSFQKLVCIFPLLSFRTTSMWVNQVHCEGSDPASLNSQRIRSFDTCKLQSVFFIYVYCSRRVARSGWASCMSKASGARWSPHQCRGSVACPRAAAAQGQLRDLLELC